MSDKSLVIVESPTKARTITKFLGKDFIVKASNGHIRDLPTNASEIPPKYKKEPWSRLGVNVENGFEVLYVIPKSKRDNVKDLKDALTKANFVYLATDEDREGESISWHLLETLKPKTPVKRLVFHEITKEAIQSSLRSARDIDENLVRAQETRRIIDRLYGYEVSPLLWKKIAPELSAGRVQSVAIRLLVERERERIAFKSAGYWGIQAIYRTASNQEFEAELAQVNGKRLASGRDFNPKTGSLSDPDKILALDEANAKKLRDDLANAKPQVASVEEKPFTNRPSPPFVTSTLQQEANNKLRFSAKRTMTVAQSLYENGFITYMRTDSTTLSDQALNAARSLIGREFGENYLPDSPRIYTTKVKNAQEAHEAIRPAGETFTPPAEVAKRLGEDAVKLYELIWKRTIASQMKDATGKQVAILVNHGNAQFRATGKTISFPGFLRAYVEGSDDPEAELADKEKILPSVKTGEQLATQNLNLSEHKTQPAARFTEGSLIRELERLGIGRPSTWATVVDTVMSRSYAFKKGTALVPTFTAFAVVQLLERHFSNLVDYEFTARLEDDLDSISRGEAYNLDYLKSFYFGNGHPGLRALVTNGQETIDPRDVCGVPLGSTEDGVNIEVRIGRYGPFVTDGERRSRVPDDQTPDELTLDAAIGLLETAAKGPEELGVDPVSGLAVYLKVGPYGPYIQAGEAEEGKRPKMVSLLPGMKPEAIDFDTALKLLSFPKELGTDPQTGEIVVVTTGRFGPYVKAGKETRSVPLDSISPLELTLNDALGLLSQPKGQGRGAKPKVIKELGEDPQSKKAITILSGRYGPYVTDGEVNASLKKGTEPETLTLEQAVNLIDERRAMGPVKKKRRSSTKKKAPL